MARTCDNRKEQTRRWRECYTNARHEQKQSATKMYFITLPRMRQYRKMQLLRSTIALKHVGPVGVKSLRTVEPGKKADHFHSLVL